MTDINTIKEEVQRRRADRNRGTYYLENLQDKNIKDFTSEDTVYISVHSKDFTNTYLCQFIKYEDGKVTAQALIATINPDLHWYDIDNGLILTAKKENVSLYGKFEDDFNIHYHSCNVLGNFRTTVKKQNENAEIEGEHESYAMARFSKGQWNEAKPLFGSSIKHRNIITLTISKAKVDRTLGAAYYQTENELIEIALSSAQFAELITTFNQGSGTPCTLRHVGRTEMQWPEYESKLQQSQEEFKKKMENIVAEMDNLLVESEEILSGKKPVNKGEKEHIQESLRRLKAQLGNNIPFITEQFSKQMNTTINEAKMEIDSHVMNKYPNGELDGATSLMLGE